MHLMHETDSFVDALRQNLFREAVLSFCTHLNNIIQYMADFIKPLNLLLKQYLLTYVRNSIFFVSKKFTPNANNL